MEEFSKTNCRRIFTIRLGLYFILVYLVFIYSVVVYTIIEWKKLYLSLNYVEDFDVFFTILKLVLFTAIYKIHS